MGAEDFSVPFNEQKGWGGAKMQINMTIPRGRGGGGDNMPFSVQSQQFTNTTFNGEANGLAIHLRDNLDIISFWGYAIQNETGVPGQSFFIQSVEDYPIFRRFIGQVDQFAVGYNSSTNDFKYVPIRITNQGLEIVTAPNITVGTRFSWQFVLFLAE